eukprot:CAMPEP_0194529416 /NCGR_PEP_ID=MMETSP0253-20130528/66093_1 /TAXON_ID=2966 /ORGANISM="Noctiluca scintillans" /LENGTH=59 /DNA_ID=CAMNT_0039374555 /DNA_START=232 /DNA_END=411 /DNA_ORIENTATION=-
MASVALTTMLRMLTPRDEKDMRSWAPRRSASAYTSDQSEQGSSHESCEKCASQEESRTQ